KPHGRLPSGHGRDAAGGPRPRVESSAVDRQGRRQVRPARRAAAGEVDAYQGSRGDHGWPPRRVSRSALPPLPCVLGADRGVFHGGHGRGRPHAQAVARDLLRVLPLGPPVTFAPTVVSLRGGGGSSAGAASSPPAVPPS